jgi:hypothetical protein
MDRGVGRKASQLLRNIAVMSSDVENSFENGEKTIGFGKDVNRRRWFESLAIFQKRDDFLKDHRHDVA